jgi:hypothetical protein
LDCGGKRSATPLSDQTGSLGWPRKALSPLRSASAVHDVTEPGVRGAAGGRIPAAEGGVAGVGKQKGQRRRFNGAGAKDRVCFVVLQPPLFNCSFNFLQIFVRTGKYRLSAPVNLYSDIVKSIPTKTVGQLLFDFFANLVFKTGWNIKFEFEHKSCRAIGVIIYCFAAVAS